MHVCPQNLRALENSLEKTQYKCKEAQNIMVNYQKLKSHLQVSSIVQTVSIKIRFCANLPPSVVVTTSHNDLCLSSL